LKRSSPRLAGDTAQARLVLEADERWVAAFNREDIETLLAIYAEDIVLMPPDGPDVHGRSAVGHWLREQFRAHAARQALWNAEVRAEGRWAWLHGAFELTRTSRATGGISRTRGKHLVVWRLDADGGWRACRDIWNEQPLNP
jgi:ketosteroid isomerase-like protein